MTALRPLLLAPCLLVLAAPAEQPRFAPEAGASVSKTLNISMAFRVDDVKLSYAGQEMPREMMGDLSNEFTGELSEGVTETYVKTADGRPLELLRTFDDLACELSDGSESEDLPGFDELEGKSVRFAWNAEEGDYTVSFVEDEGDEDLLDGLSADMDLRLLLPEGDVSTDDTWQVESTKLLPLFFPGGIVGTASDEGEDDEIGSLIEEQLEEQFQTLIEDFEVRCTYKGTHSGENGEVAEIVVSYDGQGSIDLADLINEIADSQEEAPDLSDLSASLDLKLRGEGTLRWNMAAGRAQSFEMSSEVGVSIAVEVTLSADGQTVPIALSAELSGTAEWTLDAEGL